MSGHKVTIYADHTDNIMIHAAVKIFEAILRLSGFTSIETDIENVID